jgi:ribonuclease P protein component
VEENSLHAFKFPKSHRILKRGEFVRAAKCGQVVRGKYLIIHRDFRGEGDSRLGITVTKRFGKSNVRNQFKRVIREVFRTSPISKGWDLLVRPRHFAKEASFHEIQKEFNQLTGIDS